MTHLVRAILACAAIALTASPALAHSTVKSTAPASGSVLPASPEEVTITFNEAARLTSVVVVAAGQPERKLKTAPSGSSTTFKVTAPNLANGRNEIQWKALSKDGHPVSGSIIIVVKPGAAQSSPAAHAGDHDHHR